MIPSPIFRDFAIPAPPEIIKAPELVVFDKTVEDNIIDDPLPAPLLKPKPDIEEVLAGSVNNVPPIPTPPATINAPEVVEVVTAAEFNIIEFPVPAPLLIANPETEDLLDGSVNNVPPIPTPPATINAPEVKDVVTAAEFNIIELPVPAPSLIANPETEDLFPGSVKRVPPIPTPPATTNAPVVVEVVTVVE